MIYVDANILANSLLLDLCRERQARYCTLLLTRSQKRRGGTYQIYCIYLRWPNKAGSQRPVPCSNQGFILLLQPNENGEAYGRRLYVAHLIPITRLKVFCLHAQKAEAKSLHARYYLGTTSKKVCFSHLEGICL